jgi:hypothetical protein
MSSQSFTVGHWEETVIYNLPPVICSSESCFMIQSFRDLQIWQKSMQLAVAVYRLTKDFPREEIYGLTSQIRRSAVSVPSNIAEGQGRSSLGEFR